MSSLPSEKTTLSLKEIRNNLKPTLMELCLPDEAIIKENFADEYCYAKRMQDTMGNRTELFRNPVVEVGFFIEMGELSRFVCIFSENEKYICATLVWRGRRGRYPDFVLQMSVDDPILFDYLKVVLNPGPETKFAGL